MVSLFSTETFFFQFDLCHIRESRVLKSRIPEIILSLFVFTCLNPPPEAKHREGREKLEERVREAGKSR